MNAREEFIKIYAADVRANPSAFKDHVVADPECSAASLIDGLIVAEVKGVLRDLKAELRAIGRSE